MKAPRFVLLALGVFAALGALYFGAYVVALRQPIEPYDSLRNVYLAKHGLATEVASPRWLILGGSSAWFGFQSGLIADATGQGVTNLGTHAEVPLDFQLWQAEQLARPGDTVLLAGELVHFWRERPTTFGAAELGLMAPEYFGEASWRRKRDLLAAVPPARVVAGLVARLGDARTFALPPREQLLANLRARWAGTFAGEVPGYYNYLDLDAHGDYARPRVTAAHGHDTYHLREALPASVTVGRELAAFARAMQARQVRCLFTWQPFERHAGLDFDAPLARANLAAVRRQLVDAGWREVGPPEDALMGPEFFYDTPYHLTTEGARRRTERLVERLREARMLR